MTHLLMVNCPVHGRTGPLATRLQCGLCPDPKAELTALRCEFERVRAEQIQLETLVASRADEIHKLNNRLTAALLERDALKGELRSVEAQLTADNANLCRILDRTRAALNASQAELNAFTRRVP